MARTNLADLPIELWHEIVPHTLPEGFESFALTCRTTYEICTPFIERHRHLRSRYETFEYDNRAADPSLSPILTSFDLIKRIAAEPIVARYIKHADLEYDRERAIWPSLTWSPPEIPELQDGGRLVDLFADSLYLEQAGLDGKEYRTMIREELRTGFGYSQHAATFLFTLLPNVTSLALPRRWKPLENTRKLLDIIIQKANQKHPPGVTTGLSRVVEFQSHNSMDHSNPFELETALPFLALPRVREFRGLNSMAMTGDPMTLVPKPPYLGYGKTLESIHLLASSVDDVAIAEFLRHTPRLKTLKYSHSGRDCHRGWDICKFVAAIEHAVGSHLEEISIIMGDVPGLIVSERVSLRNFQRLRKLELSLYIATCNVTYAEAQAAKPDNQMLDNYEPCIGDLVSPSVSQLSLLSNGSSEHGKALELLFRDLTTKRDVLMPALQEIDLRLYHDGFSERKGFEKHCRTLLGETKTIGMVSILHCDRLSIILRNMMEDYNRMRDLYLAV